MGFHSSDVIDVRLADLAGHGFGRDIKEARDFGDNAQIDKVIGRNAGRDVEDHAEVRVGDFRAARRALRAGGVLKDRGGAGD